MYWIWLVNQIIKFLERVSHKVFKFSTMASTVVDTYSYVCTIPFNCLNLWHHLTSPVTQQKRIHRHCRRCRRHGFNPRVRKIPWRRKWQPTLVFLPGEPHGQRSLVGCSPWGRKESDVTEWLSTYGNILQNIGVWGFSIFIWVLKCLSRLKT